MFLLFSLTYIYDIRYTIIRYTMYALHDFLFGLVVTMEGVGVMVDGVGVMVMVMAGVCGLWFVEGSLRG